MKKILCGCLAALAVLLLCSCVAMGDGDYKSALDDAWEAGYSAANEDWEERVADIQSDSRRDGLDVGYQEGYNEGYLQGKNDGAIDGFDDGYDAGYRQGQRDVADHAALMYGLCDSADVKYMIGEGDMTLDEFLDSYQALVDYLWSFLN